MEFFRVTRDLYGREVLQGMSWDLIGVFFGLGCLLIIGHAIYRSLLASQKS